MHATVYSWRDENGKLHFCNDQEEVPEAHRTSAKTFKSKLAAQNPVEVPVTAPAPSAEPVAISAYERGLERGLQAAERQVALAGELARTLLAAAPQPPPSLTSANHHCPTPTPVVRYVSPEPAYAPPYYGFIAPYSTYSVFRTTTRTHTGLGEVASFAIRISFPVPADDGQDCIFPMDIPDIVASSSVMDLSCADAT